MKVIYPVLFYEEDDGKYSVFVPDLQNSSTCGSNLEEAMEMAEDLIAGIVLDEMEEGIRDAAGKKIKKPKIKEATKDTSKAAEEAISKPKFKDDGIRFTKDNVTYERHRNPNWQEGDARK